MKHLFRPAKLLPSPKRSSTFRAAAEQYNNATREAKSTFFMTARCPPCLKEAPDGPGISLTEIKLLEFPVGK